jgi:hypothetical protein
MVIHTRSPSAFFTRSGAVTSLFSAMYICVISGFRSGVNEVCALLVCYAVQNGNLLPTFRDLSVPSSTITQCLALAKCAFVGVKKEWVSQDAHTVNSVNVMNAIGLSKKLANIYESTRCYNSYHSWRYIFWVSYFVGQFTVFPVVHDKFLAVRKTVDIYKCVTETAWWRPNYRQFQLSLFATCSAFLLILAADDK